MDDACTLITQRVRLETFRLGSAARRGRVDGLKSGYALAGRALGGDNQRFSFANIKPGAG
jgi:hypothetical protein